MVRQVGKTGVRTGSRIARKNGESSEYLNRQVNSLRLRGRVPVPMETRVAMLAGPNNRSSHDVGVIRLPWRISVMKNPDDFPGGPDREILFHKR